MSDEDSPCPESGVRWTTISGFLQFHDFTISRAELMKKSPSRISSERFFMGWGAVDRGTSSLKLRTAIPAREQRRQVLVAPSGVGRLTLVHMECSRCRCSIGRHPRLHRQGRVTRIGPPRQQLQLLWLRPLQSSLLP